jgi:hypothetical protein
LGNGYTSKRDTYAGNRQMVTRTTNSVPNRQGDSAVSYHLWLRELVSQSITARRPGEKVAVAFGIRVRA